MPPCQNQSIKTNVPVQLGDQMGENFDTRSAAVKFAGKMPGGEENAAIHDALSCRGVGPSNEWSIMFVMSVVKSYRELPLV